MTERSWHVFGDIMQDVMLVASFSLSLALTVFMVAEFGSVEQAKALQSGVFFNTSVIVLLVYTGLRTVQYSERAAYSGVFESLRGESE